MSIDRSRVTSRLRSRYRESVRLAGIIALSIVSSSVQADVRLPSVFASHMVIQREQPIRIHGTADVGETVGVQLSDAVQETTTGADGHWQVVLPAMKAGGPHRLVVRGNNEIELKDVLIGDVWLASGQSNMEQSLGEKLAAAIPANSQIRVFTKFAAPHITAQDDLPGSWSVCKPGSRAASFSTVGYYYAARLQKETGIPIGLLHSSKGGTHIEQWLPQAVYRRCGENVEQRLTTMGSSTAELTAEYDRYFLDTVALNRRRFEGERIRRSAMPKAPELPSLGRYRGWPMVCHNAYIHPIEGHAIKGILWYQGESNAGIFGWGQPSAYGDKLGALIAHWRAAWKNNSLPVYIVQLPNNGKPSERSDQPDSNGWSQVRMEQLRTSWQVPHTRLIVTIDIGGSLHPEAQLKEELAGRLADSVLVHSYQRGDIAAAGPMPSRAEFKDGQILIDFTNQGTGLRDRDGGQLRGFAIETKVVQRGKVKATLTAARARMVGGRVVVDATGFDRVSGVAYAYSKNPTCDLFNSRGLPLTPFLLPLPFANVAAESEP